MMAVPIAHRAHIIEMLISIMAMASGDNYLDINQRQKLGSEFTPEARLCWCQVL
jgi:hypothetical protein